MLLLTLYLIIYLDILSTMFMTQVQTPTINIGGVHIIQDGPKILPELHLGAHMPPRGVVEAWINHVLSAGVWCKRSDSVQDSYEEQEF